MGKAKKIRLILLMHMLVCYTLGVIRREEGQMHLVIIPMGHIMDTIELMMPRPSWYALRINGLQVLPGIGGYRRIFVSDSG